MGKKLNVARKRWLWFAVIAALGTLLLGGVLWGSTLTTWFEMNQYLRNRYGEEFIVDMPVKQYGGLAQPGVWVSNAHPRAESHLDFQIDGNQPGHYKDQYIDVLWSYREAQRMRPELEKIGTLASVRVVVTGDLQKKANRKSPTINEAMKHYPNDMRYILLINNFEIADRYDDIYKVIEEIRAKGVKRIDIDGRASEYKFYADEVNVGQLQSSDDLKKYLEAERNQK